MTTVRWEAWKLCKTYSFVSVKFGLMSNGSFGSSVGQSRLDEVEFMLTSEHLQFIIISYSSS